MEIGIPKTFYPQKLQWVVQEVVATVGCVSVFQPNFS